MTSKERRMAVVAAIAIAAAALLARQLPWEIGGESWGYWYFAKQLASGAGFVTPDRSPLYTVYILPFLLFPPLLSTVVESFVSTCISALAVYYLLRWRLGSLLAGLFSILWIPFFQQMEPANQTLGLACVCLAFGIRLRSSGVNAERLTGVSYALIVAASLFRANYGLYLILILAYDLWVFRREGRSTMGALVLVIKALRSWSFVALVTLAVIFTAFQASNRWNNVWFASTEWFPGSDQSLGTTSVIGHFNWRYIESKYGSFEGRDIYFTHKEAFGGATSIPRMIQSNPRLFTEIVATNVKDFFALAIFNFSLPAMPVRHLRGLLSLFVFSAMCYGAIRAVNSKLLLVYVGGSLILVFLTSLSFPKVRYMVPLVPVIALSAWWYGTKLVAVAATRGVERPWIYKAITIAVLLLFSVAPIVQWLEFVKAQVVMGEAETERSTSVSSMKAAFPELKRQVTGCKGIMSMEHMFFGAFVIEQPNMQNFDIWEIPPFGSYGLSAYRGLTPGRVDCLFISSGLEYTTGMGTNNQIRYQGYIKPYAEYLVSIGAKAYLIPGYGRVIKWTPVEVGRRLEVGGQ